MTILQIFNKYQKPGGEEASVLRVADTLDKDHKVIRCYFDSNEWAERSGILARLRQAFSMLWNPVAIRRVRREIDEHQPDLILLHNIFPICSAAMLFMLVRGRAPVVQYVHNFRPFSVNGYLWGEGRLLDQGLDKNFIPEILDGAWQDSRVRTAWYAMILWGLHATGTFRRIDRWIAISEFMRRKFVEAGLPPQRVEMLRHSWNPSPRLTGGGLRQTSESETPYILFLGRLTTAKGVDVLLDAWRMARPRAAKLVIGGEGPMDQTVMDAAAIDPSIVFHGHVTGERKFRLLEGARAVVAPSVWWEPLGIVVYEAYDHQKPALVAASGGLTETVLHGQTGLLHAPGDASELARHIVSILEDRAYAHKLGTQGKAHLLETTHPATWKSRMDEILEDVVAGASSVPESHHASPLNPRITIYLADQNPKLGRSLGISRMTEAVLEEMQARGTMDLRAVTSISSISVPEGMSRRVLPWETRNTLSRVLTDHMHPLLLSSEDPDVWYFPKGFLPAIHMPCAPSVVTIHDTIVQYYADHFPKWRTNFEYRYWAGMLKHTLRHADHILTVSYAAKSQIEAFRQRYGLPEKEITVTYEPCLYESTPQPMDAPKGAYALHLASREPHKRTAWLVRHWLATENAHLPPLHLVGVLPEEISAEVAAAPQITALPFLDDNELRAQFLGARVLVFPSEIEGFGLPAVEAYFLGTPVCYVKGTSVEEVLEVATKTGGFDLAHPESLNLAIKGTLAMRPEEIHLCGLRLREAYAASKVVERMEQVLRKAAGRKACLLRLSQGL